MWSRRDIFYLLSKKFHLDIAQQVEIVREKVAEKGQVNYEFNSDVAGKLRWLLSKMKIKWKECNRTTERFLHNNAEWLKQTIILKVRIAAAELEILLNKIIYI